MLTEVIIVPLAVIAVFNIIGFSISLFLLFYGYKQMRAFERQIPTSEIQLKNLNNNVLIDFSDISRIRIADSNVMGGEFGIFIWYKATKSFDCLVGDSAKMVWQSAIDLTQKKGSTFKNFGDHLLADINNISRIYRKNGNKNNDGFCINIKYREGKETDTFRGNCARTIWDSAIKYANENDSVEISEEMVRMMKEDILGLK